jgi:uncharacterized protein (TIGR02996 family)
VTTTTTIAAMLAAVRKDRDDDTPRLALADVLAETDPDEGGDAGWAEFIRLGVEMAKTPETEERSRLLEVREWYDMTIAAREKLEQNGGRFRVTDPANQMGTLFYTAPNPAWQELCRLCNTLRAAHEARWRRGPACERCGGKGKIRVRLSSNRHWTRTDPARRRQNHASCPDCAGTGWTGPLGDREPGGDARYGGQAGGASRWRVPATFRRGFIAAVSTPLADVFQGDTVTPWAVRVARWPQVCLEEWGLTDREPHDWTREDGGREYVWTVRTENQIPVPGDIPHRAFHKLEGGRFNSDRWACRFPAPDVAQHALAKAVAQVVNEAARERG